MATMTGVVHAQMKDGETYTECIHRISLDEETLTQAQHRLVEDGTPDPTVITLTFTSVTDAGFKVTWNPQLELDVEYNLVEIEDGGVDITGSPFTMAGSTLSKTVSGLDPSTTYDVTVTAVDSEDDDIATVTDSQDTTA